MKTIRVTEATYHAIAAAATFPFQSTGERQADGTWLVLRVPYPLGFFSRGMDGRIDDANAGWKGRAIYADYGPNAVWHMEGGLGTRSAVVKFQLRPDPLAK